MPAGGTYGFGGPAHAARHGKGLNDGSSNAKPQTVGMKAKPRRRVSRLAITTKMARPRLRVREGQAMKPKRKSYNEEFYELDNLYNEDLRDRYQPMNYNYGWYA